MKVRIDLKFPVAASPTSLTGKIKGRHRRTVVTRRADLYLRIGVNDRLRHYQLLSVADLQPLPKKQLLRRNDDVRLLLCGDGPTTVVLTYRDSSLLFSMY